MDEGRCHVCFVRCYGARFGGLRLSHGRTLNWPNSTPTLVEVGRDPASLANARVSFPRTSTNVGLILGRLLNSARISALGATFEQFVGNTAARRDRLGSSFWTHGKPLSAAMLPGSELCPWPNLMVTPLRLQARFHRRRSREGPLSAVPQHMPRSQGIRVMTVAGPPRRPGWHGWCGARGVAPRSPARSARLGRRH